MKKNILGLCGAATMILLAGSPAKSMDLYGFGSYWDKGDADGKAGVGIGLGTPFLSEHLHLDGRIHFIEKSELAPGDKLTLIPIDLGAQGHLMPGSALDPYVLAGLSFIYADAERTDVDSSFGTYLGGGVEWTPLPIVRLFGEAVYRFQELDGGRGGDVDVSGLTGNVGVRVSF